jgi:O-acetyl-ADP-ribose deacetylase (regulator of RNase III)
MIIEIEGDLIDLALKGNFDVIVHGCNCFCQMRNGLAPQMAKAFGCDKFSLELSEYANEYGDIIPTNNVGDVNKLGQIQYKIFGIKNEKVYWIVQVGSDIHKLAVVNAYTQFKYGTNHHDGDETPFDYEAFTLCMRKINHRFNGYKIGLPRIGAGLAGGDWEIIKQIITKELKDCYVTIVTLPKSL